MVCPDWRNNKIDIAKAESNGWQLAATEDRVFKDYPSDEVSSDGPTGLIVRIYFIYDENRFIINCQGIDNADPRNMYTCVCPPTPPMPCYLYTDGFKNIIFNEIVSTAPPPPSDSTPIVFAAVAGAIIIGGIIMYYLTKKKR